MRPLWIRGADDTDAELIRKEFEAAVLFRERLVEILEEEIERSVKDMRSKVKDSNTPNLTEYYVDCLSRQRTLDEVIKLIKA